MDARRADGTRPEIWLSGVRNPWRWSFDRQTGDIYIGDVGQNEVEEIDLVPAGVGGQNLGWNHKEGDQCYSNPDCASESFLDPIAVYDHPVPDHCTAVTGGYVYRGACSPDLDGWYFYGDYCLERVFMLKAADGAVTDGPTEITAQLDPTGDLIKGLSSFGEDAYGELYLVSRRNGILYHLSATP